MGANGSREVRALRPLGPASTHAPTDADLVLAGRDGNGAALGELAQRHARRIYGLAFRLVHGPEAEDLAHDAFAIAFSRLHSLDEPERFASWLSGILVRVVYRFLRRKRIARRLGLVPPSEPFDVTRHIAEDAPAEVREELAAVYRLVDALPVQVRMTLLLHRVDGLRLAEVAEHLQISERTAKRRLAEAERALAQFRKDGAT